ncbi:flagellar filament capping protein FliD [Paenibacillus sp. GCM10027629]|uniref:flagellar filament capping protein FliD n=1 Tax=Paenibacillus sp. GCM10027629 TaxID=3273414 RepID=UPI003633F4F6
MPMRITGMGSGLDIDKLVTDLMKAERIPLDKTKQKKTLVGWQSDLYREVNTKLAGLRKAADKIRLQGDWSDYKAASTNENVVSATVGPGVPSGNHKVEVTSLATGASITGGKLTNFDPSAKFGDKGSITLTTGGKDYTIDITADDTYNTIMNNVNSSPASVRMSFDEITKKVSIVTKETGDGVKLSVSDNTGGTVPGTGILDKLNLTNPVGEKDPLFDPSNNTQAKLVSGKSAIVKIDGVVIDPPPKSNTFTANGITYKFQDVTTEPVTIRVGGDNDGMVKQITEFVDAYNSTVELLNQRTKEKKFRGFDPLTDDQKADMKEADIKNWEEKAKSGLLGNDIILKKTLNDLRSISNKVLTSLPDGMNTLFKIGISTMPYNAATPNDAGKLSIDEAKLRKAIAEDAGAVVRLFTNAGEKDPLDDKKDPDLSPQSGIARNMYKSIDSSIQELIAKAGGVGTPVESNSNILGKKLTDINKQIATFNDKLARKEDYYYKMFAAMDSAVAKNNSQLNWLMQNGR